MRWLGYVVGLCLLCAGVVPRGAAHDVDRPHDEIAAANALAKVAVRRESGARVVGACGLAPFALVLADPLPEPSRVCVEIAFADHTEHAIAPRIAKTARGPPQG